jgi:DNA-binding transcriptional LysR family regulator
VNVAANDHIWRFQGPKGAVAAKVSSVFASNSALALRKAALAGLGVTMVPRYSVAEDLGAGLLVALLPRHRIAPRPLFAVHPRAASVPQKVQVLVDFLRDWVAARDMN